MEQLLQRIEKMEREIQNLKRSATIPRDVETAFSERLGSLGAKGTGTATTQTIQLTGNAQDITVPAQPSGTLQVTFKNTTYNLLYK
jgi:hypothetical protein